MKTPRSSGLAVGCLLRLAQSPDGARIPERGCVADQPQHLARPVGWDKWAGAGFSTRCGWCPATPTQPRSGSQSAIAFTLVELLVVISIMGILAALSVPAFKSLGKSNVQTSAARQMLDDVGRARQLALSQHTIVNMVFIPTNFFNLNTVPLNALPDGAATGPTILNALASITPIDTQRKLLNALTNLVDKQLTGYSFVSHGKVGDQPGQHDWHYLHDWQSLPEGTFIAAQKFLPRNYYMTIPQWAANYVGQIDNWLPLPEQQIYGFTNVAVPFPTEDSPYYVYLPCITFNHLGHLISETPDGASFHHAYLPLAQGSVSYGRDINKRLQPTPVLPADITEVPPGNSTSISFNVIDVEPLTGRATLQHYKMP